MLNPEPNWSRLGVGPNTDGAPRTNRPNPQNSPAAAGAGAALSPQCRGGRAGQGRQPRRLPRAPHPTRVSLAWRGLLRPSVHPSVPAQEETGHPKHSPAQRAPELLPPGHGSSAAAAETGGGTGSAQSQGLPEPPPCAAAAAQTLLQQPRPGPAPPPTSPPPLPNAPRRHNSLKQAAQSLPAPAQGPRRGDPQRPPAPTNSL